MGNKILLLNERRVSDFSTQNCSGTAADDKNSVQILIDALHFKSSNKDKVDDNELIISLQNLETGPVMLDVSPANATKDIFLKMEEVTLGVELFPLKKFPDFTVTLLQISPGVKMLLSQLILVFNHKWLPIMVKLKKTRPNQKKPV